MWVCLAGALVGLRTADVATDTQVSPLTEVRFAAVDVFIDSGREPLAAYQFELTAEVGEIVIVGIEGGEHRAFAEPPYYDPAALSHDRVIIAAFNTGRDLPTGKTRVARVHVQITGPVEPEYVVRLEVAANPRGERIAGAGISVAMAGQGEGR